MNRWCLRLLLLATVSSCIPGMLRAQNDVDATNLLGNWVYSLGPKTLFGLHLERNPAKPDKLQGYVMLPEDFNFNSVNGVLLTFSKISGKGERHPVASSSWHEGALELKDPAPAKDNNEVTFSVKPVDKTHVDFTLFPSSPNLRMERASAEPQLADGWDSKRTYTQDDFASDNEQMASIVARDQADRKDELTPRQQEVERADRERRIQTLSLVRQGALHTGHDFESAALVFQHGEAPDDYLLAHVFAIIAISKGQIGAVWISAATLDRYLQHIHQPQIFGTQFKTIDKEPSTQEPYNRDLISNYLRVYMGVPDQAAQDAQRHQNDVQRGVGSTTP